MYMNQSLEGRIHDLASMPLFSSLPSQAIRAIAERSEPLQFAKGDTIISPDGERHMLNYLYIVGTGLLLQTGTGSLNIPWLDRILKRGDAFNRYTLLYGYPPETTVRAVDHGYLYRIEAARLNYILMQWPQLRDRLIPAQRIHRLRAMPLYSVLPDDHLRRLADHIIEKHLQPREVYQRGANDATVWVVAEGQVILVPEEASGPTSQPPSDASGIPYYETAPPLSLTLATVGQVFVDGEVAHLDLPPKKVRAVSETVLYGLPRLKFEELVERFRNPSLPLDQDILTFVHPPDMKAYFQAVEEFKVLPPEWLEHLAGFTAWIYSPRSQMVVQQGVHGRAMYILTEGEAIVRAVDERGRRRPRSYIFPLGYVGRRALLQGTEHDVTVEATQPSYWLRISREDLDRFDWYTRPDTWPLRRQKIRCAFHRILDGIRAYGQGRAPHPCPRAWRSVWEYLGGVPIPVEKRLRTTRTWHEPDERVIWMGRRHWIYLAIKLILPVLIISFALSLLVSGVVPSTSVQALYPMALVLLAGMAVWVYVVVDYFNDYYALTDRRVVHLEREVLQEEVWEDIPLEQVQDVIYRQGFFGKTFGYATLIVQSAAAGGNIVMPSIPHARDVQAAILAERVHARARRHAWRRERLRHDLQKRLQAFIHAEWPEIATGKRYPHRILSARARRQWLRKLQKKSPSKFQKALRFVARALLSPFKALRTLLFPQRLVRKTTLGATPLWPKITWREGESYYWRKHWLRLIQRVMLPLSLFIVMFSAFFLIRLGKIPLIHKTGGEIAAILLMLAAFVWLLWSYDDWRNDLYILTPDRLIDIERKPFYLHEERREAPLSQVQNVQTEMRGIIAHIFNYGEVVIKTAAEGGDLKFYFVPHPREIAQTIQRQLNEYRRRQEEREHLQRQAQLAETLEIYDELLRSRLTSRWWQREDMD